MSDETLSILPGPLRDLALVAKAVKTPFHQKLDKLLKSLPARIPLNRLLQELNLRDSCKALAILRDYCESRGLTYEGWKGEVIVDRVDADNRSIPLKYYADDSGDPAVWSGLYYRYWEVDRYVGFRRDKVNLTPELRKRIKRILKYYGFSYYWKRSRYDDVAFLILKATPHNIVAEELFEDIITAIIDFELSTRA